MKTYIVIEAYDTQFLEIEVNRKIKEGYKPQGGVMFIPETKNTVARVYQAMILINFP